MIRNAISKREDETGAFSITAATARTVRWKERAESAEKALDLERTRSRHLLLRVSRLEEKAASRGVTPGLVALLAFIGMLFAVAACFR